MAVHNVTVHICNNTACIVTCHWYWAGCPYIAQVRIFSSFSKQTHKSFTCKIKVYCMVSAVKCSFKLICIVTYRNISVICWKFNSFRNGFRNFKICIAVIISPVYLCCNGSSFVPFPPLNALSAYAICIGINVISRQIVINKLINFFVFSFLSLLSAYILLYYIILFD